MEQALHCRPARSASVPGALALSGLAAAFFVSVSSVPAEAAVYAGQSLQGDLTLSTGDSVIGDLSVAGTLTVATGDTVPVSSSNPVTLTAAHIVIAGVLDGSGGNAAAGAGPGVNGAAAASGTACGGGGGGGSAGTGGSGGSGGGTASGGPGGLAYLSGPGSGGGSGATCGSGAGGRGGRGGAAIRLVSPDIRISGAVHVDGRNGDDGALVTPGFTGGGGGGGAGGEIELSGATLLSGALTALGGLGGAGSVAPSIDPAGGGGGGSGGRIVLDSGSSLIGQNGYVLSANQFVPALGGPSRVAQPGSAGGLGTVPAVASPTTTSTTVSSSSNPSTAGQSVTFTAVVSPTASGTVGFAVDNSAVTGCSAVPVATTGSATCSTAGLPAGSHAVAATFTSMDPGFDGSTGVLDPLQEVDPVLLPQAISFPAVSDHVVGQAPFALSGVTGGASGNPVTFTAGGPCSVTGGAVRPTGVGTCTITADQAATSGYLAAPSVSRSFAISYVSATVGFSVDPRRGGLVTVLLRLKDAAGHNLSSAAVPVRATAFDGRPLGDVFTPVKGGTFPYVAARALYRFAEHLRARLTPGSHALTYTAGADPRPHAISFTSH
jgi:hypothetical protein